MYQARHLAARPGRATEPDRRLGGWLVTIGALLLAGAFGAALAGPLLVSSP